MNMFAAFLAMSLVCILQRPRICHLVRATRSSDWFSEMQHSPSKPEASRALPQRRFKLTSFPSPSSGRLDGLDLGDELRHALRDRAYFGSCAGELPATSQPHLSSRALASTVWLTDVDGRVEKTEATSCP
ncbi:hypothetical protein BGZ60DRAFT_66644 [Tricladium varicosporioides]|nr:hypothetical protein BGZ60DRAFT_66644 [Hymenoscyphus varicosporioides]